MALRGNCRLGRMRMKWRRAQTMLAEWITNVAIGMTAGSTLWLALRAGKVVVNAEMQSKLIAEIITQQMELLRLQVGINSELMSRLGAPGWVDPVEEEHDRLLWEARMKR